MTNMPISDVVSNLVEIIGRKLTAYIGSAQDVSTIDWWIAGGELSCDAEARLRFALQLARGLAQEDSSAVVQAWFTGVNPELEDRAPIRLLREEDIETVSPTLLAAARNSELHG